VAGITPVPGIIKKSGLPAGVNPLQMFRLAEPDWVLYETFSKGLKAKIEASPEFKALKKAPAPQAASGGGSGFDDMDEDIPFVSSSMHHDMQSSIERKMRRYDF
jgi:hypothetical protein